MGYDQAHKQTVVLLQGDVVACATALQSLRAGDWRGGVRRIEDHYYATVLLLMNAPVWHSRLAHALVNDVVAYRGRYATNAAEFTEVEKRLDDLVPKWGDTNRDHQGTAP